ncbi:MAG: methyl-accepting chemotaxis protein, partial [Betaproteobacteria bacterium]|nr:methyl-accepting chemotaxis protein [Betaproteobacteria bacterium]
MKWFLDLTTRVKLLVCFGLIFALMAWVIATGYAGIAAIRESQNRLYSEYLAEVRDLMALRVYQNQMRALMLEAQLLSKRAEQDPLLAQAAERSKQIDRILSGLLARAVDDPGKRSHLEELKGVWQAFAQTKDAEIIPLILAGKTTESRGLAVGVQQEREQRIRAISEQLGKVAEEAAQLAVARADQKAEASFRVFLLAGIVFVVIGIATVLSMERAIAVPLRTLSRAADRVAVGDLTGSAAPQERADEVGVLTRAFGSMHENLRRMTNELHEGVGVLASSSSEILATTTQVASSAAQTASAVSETTATVEEVKQTAQVASQKAKYVSESAQKVSQVSQTGRKSVEDAVQGMHRIQEQMDSIAQSIVRLSE